MCGLATACLFLLAAWAAGASAGRLEGENYRRYQKLRRNFYIAVAMPPLDEGIRREHKAYYQQATRFVDAVADAYPRAKAAVLFRRARIVLHCRRYEKARQDFESALTLLETALDEDAEGVRGVPSPEEVRFYHALTFRGDSEEALLDKLRALPTEAVAKNKSQVTELMESMIMDLHREERFRVELKAYEVIKKHGLWDDNAANDPDKHISILRARIEEAN